MRQATLLSFSLLLLSGAAAAAPIPPHPDKIPFKPFTYVPPKAKDHRQVLPQSKVVSYLAVDRELPLVTVQIYVRTGEYLDPRGREGLAGLSGYLMARGGTDGKKPYSAEAMEERLAYLAANLNSAVGPTQGVVSLNLLSKDLDEGLALLRDVLSAPRFDEKRMALRKDQMLGEMKQRNDDAADIEARERGVLSFGADHFTNRWVTKASLEGLTRQDLVAFHRRYFHPGNFFIAAAGDFDREAMVKKLDAMLSGWPYQGEVAAGEIPRPTERPRPGVYLVNKGDVTQGRVSILLPGMQRDEPDYYAIQVMNQVLGGGGFISRITNRVRSDEGLAYQAGSRFAGGVYYPDVFLALFQSKLRTCSYAAAIVLEEMKKLREGGVTAGELQTGKKSLIETLPQRFRTKAQAVDVLLQEEFTGRYKTDPDYYQHFQERIEKVTDKDVARVAKKWLDEKAVAILLVGKKDALLNPDPKHPVQFTELAGGKIIDVPLRDPLTMQPVAPGQRPTVPAQRPAATPQRPGPAQQRPSPPR